MQRLLLISLSLILSACTAGGRPDTPIQPPAGTIIRTQDGAQLTPQQLQQELAGHAIVLIGEQHDQPAHHQAEQWLAANRPAGGSTLLEMLSQDQQNAVQRTQHFLQQGGYSTQSGLADKLHWNRAWPWQAYGALMRTLLAGQSQVLPANPSKESVAQAGNYRPAGQSASAEVRQALAAIISGLHGGDAQSKVSQQQFKDRTMAENLFRAPKPAWLIAGAIHASKTLGVPLHLQDLESAQPPAVLILTSPGSGIDLQHADYLWRIP